VTIWIVMETQDVSRGVFASKDAAIFRAKFGPTYRVRFDCIASDPVEAEFSF
jgi:hypothetical protein